MLKKLLNFIFKETLQSNYSEHELFLSKSSDHYDLDFRIKLIDTKTSKLG